MGLPDLGALKGTPGQQQDEPPQLLQVRGVVNYVNDVETALNPAAGTVILKFFYRSNAGVNEPVSIAMPIGMFFDLANQAPELEQAMSQMLERVRAQGGSMAAAQAARDQA